MHYIIVSEITGMTALERAQKWSRELYNITIPDALQEDYQKDGHVIGTITHPDGRVALNYVTNHEIWVHPQVDLVEFFSLFPDITEAEVEALDYTIKNVDKIELGQIIPSSETLMTQEMMQEDGWFPEVSQNMIEE